jgi:GNAT superfamily N-acetyltransferase
MIMMMTVEAVEIRDARPADEAVWRRLWAEYLRFYRTELAESVTADVWRRIHDPASSLFCRVAVCSEQVLGFAVCVMHEGTWSALPCCYLEDLYVDEAARGQGAGAALIDDLLARGRKEGWRRLYWHTQTDNATARRLYDRFAQADGFVRYDVDLR